MGEEAAGDELARVSVVQEISKMSREFGWSLDAMLEMAEGWG